MTCFLFWKNWKRDCKDDATAVTALVLETPNQSLLHVAFGNEGDRPGSFPGQV